MTQLGQWKHSTALGLLKGRTTSDSFIVVGRLGKRMPSFGKRMPTNDATGPTEALGQRLGS